MISQTVMRAIKENKARKETEDLKEARGATWTSRGMSSRQREQPVQRPWGRKGQVGVRDSREARG